MPEWIVINKDGLDANLRFTNAPCAAAQDWLQSQRIGNAVN